MFVSVGHFRGLQSSYRTAFSQMAEVADAKTGLEDTWSRLIYQRVALTIRNADLLADTRVYLKIFSLKFRKKCTINCGQQALLYLPRRVAPGFY